MKLALSFAVLAALLAPASTAQVPLPAGDWQLVWSDEFEAPKLDRAKWSFDVDCWGGGNAERQCYTDSKRNAAIAGGMLVITALRQRSEGPALPKSQRQASGLANQTATREFSSARLTTRGKAAWRYGRFEMRARLPQGQGTWPAFWMLPESDRYGAWAASGEIDILEAVNLGVPCAKCVGLREDTVLGTIHFGAKWPHNTFASTEIHAPQVLEGFHTYAVEWQPGQITWLLDGKVYATKRASDWSTTGSKVPGAPFDQPFHLILNLAIGGHLPEERGLRGVALGDFPKRYEIDWIRVWQKPATAANGGATQPGRGNQ